MLAATMMLFPVKTLSRASNRKTSKQAALVQHTQGGLCLKLRKHKKEAAISILIEMMALRMYNFLFYFAHSSMVASSAYTRSTKTMAMKM
jgi:hypothetical protein